MFENRNLKLDLYALALTVASLFLALSLLTYDRSDAIGELVSPLNRIYQPDQLVYPPGEQIENYCGWCGALTADLLFRGFGLGAYYLVGSLIIVCGLLLARREIDSPYLRFAGWAASLIGLTALAAMALPWFSPGPVIGAGGYLGALGKGILQSHFATLGAVILALSVVAGGLLLCTDYVLLNLAFISAIWTAKRVGEGGRRIRRKRLIVVGSDVDDEWEDEEEAEQSQALKVKVGGRNEEESDDELEDEYLEEEDYDDDEEPEEAGVAANLIQSVKNKLTPKLKVMAPPKPEKEKPAKKKTPSKKEAEKAERERVREELDEASQTDDASDYELPSIDLLLEGDEFCHTEQEKEVRRKAKILEKTFESFGFNVKVVEIETGPVIAQYEVELEAGLRLSRITGLSDDLAIALRVPSVRIVAPIPGKNTVGIEVPNEERQIVRLRDAIEEANGRVSKMKIPLFLGKDVAGKPMTVDLATLPHLLIAGRTGTGKSVCLNAIITSILMTRRPDEVRMLMIDPKMVELSCYRTLPHLMHPVVTDMKKAEAILGWAVDKMEERYALLAKAGVRQLSVYNQLSEEELMDRLEPENDEERKAIPLNLPYIVIVADEIADLMMTSGKEVEQHIIRLAQKSRAVGIHLILATQKPTVDVITGLIKSNLPARLSFQVASRTDSRVVLDEMGADKLLGNGDMLFLWPGTSTLLRGQGTYLTDDEINDVVDAVSTGEQSFVKELVQMKVDEGADEKPGQLKKRDDLYESAVDVVVREGRGSVSLLQRTLGIGYGRAARLIDYMEEDAIVGPYAGSQAREVLMTTEQWAQMQGEEPEPAPSRPANTIIPIEDSQEDEPAQAEESTATTETEDELEDAEEDEYEEEYEEAEDDGDEYEEDEYEEEDGYEAESA